MMKNDQNYFDACCLERDNPIFMYRSGLAVYEEEFRDGGLFPVGFNSAGFPVCKEGVNFDTSRTTIEPSSFHLELDGKCADYGYVITDFSKEELDECVRSVLTLDNTVFPVRVYVHTELDGTGTFARAIEVENLSDKPISISRIAVFNAMLDRIVKSLPYRSNVLGNKAADFGDFFSIGYFDDRGWAREGEFVWRALEPDMTVIDMRYRRSKFRHPLIFIKNNVSGKIWYCQMEWTAGCSYALDYHAYPDAPECTLAFTAEIEAHKPMLVLRAGEKYMLPKIHIGLTDGDLDDAINCMHAHTRRITLKEADPKECLVIGSCGEVPDYMDTEKTKAYARKLSELGAEVFMIDAGWQCPLGRHEHRAFNGTNQTDPARYPNGLSEISDYCHELGMKFGLWTEIERIGNLSPVYNEHPEWRGVSMYGKRSETYLDMTVPEAAAWAESELARFIEEYKLDVLRIDHVNPGSAHFSMRDTGTGINECLSLRHYEAVYNMYRNLKLRYPDVIFENCAGGGGRTDLGMMRFFNHTWVSDNQVMPSSVIIANGMTMALPPERVDRLFGGMQSYTLGSLDAQVRNTMLSHMTFNSLSYSDTENNPIHVDFVQHSVDIYKSFIRKILPTCLIFHHTPEAEACMYEGICIREISSPDGAMGAATVISLSFSGERTVTLRLKGVDLSKKYRVTLDNSRNTYEAFGHELHMKGLIIDLPSSMSSELVLYEEI